ncbi:cya1 [Acrasis kona]|uniref:Cya1 n=1 Tax=Acrasis kona TaxID=1008807 RepID=A0AAW2Z6Y9_9EUKA
MSNSYQIPRSPSVGSIQSIDYVREDVESVDDSTLVSVQKDGKGGILWCLSNAWSLQVLIIILFTAGIAVTGVVVLLVGFFSAERGITSVSNKAQGYLKLQMVEYVQNLLSEPPRLATSALTSIYSFDPSLDLSDLKTYQTDISRLMYPTLFTSRFSTAILVPTIRDQIIGLQKTPVVVGGKSTFRMDLGVKNSTNKALEFRALNSSGLLTGPIAISVPNYNIFSRPFWIQGTTTLSLSWTPITITINPVLSLAAFLTGSFYNQSNPSQTLGVVSVLIELSSLSTFLAKAAAVTDGVEIYIMERSGLIVATSSGNFSASIAGQPARVAARTHSSSVVADSSNFLYNFYGNFSYAKDGDAFLFKDSLGVRRSLQISILLDQYGIDWVLVGVLNYDIVMSTVSSASIINIVVSVCAVIAAMTTSVVIGCCISLPLKNFASQMGRIADMKLDKQDKVTLQLKEFKMISTSMEQMRSGLSNFEKFVPADVVRSMLKKNSQIQPGVICRNLTVLFMDIKDFTTITENIEPNKLISLMSKFFAEMTAAITRNNGTVDKFIGDCIMAMWNAPDHVENHELCCIQACFDMFERLESLNRKWESKQYPKIRVRIGVNTNDNLVGNIGSPERLNYTALGDGVNVAARLEALNKRYNTPLLIGENTYHAVKEKYVCVFVDRISVKGKNKPIDVYTVVCLESESTPDVFHTRDKHEQIRIHLKENNIDKVVKLCQDLTTKDSSNIIAKLLLERLQEKPTGHLVLHEA